MPPATLYKFPTSSPADTSSLISLSRLGYSKEDILGIAGKTEGNGCVNDFSRTLSSLAWDDLIPRTSISIFSGGTEGVLSPHLTFVLQSENETTGLVAAVGRTWQLQPRQIGSKDHVICAAATVRKMLEAERIKAQDVRMVLIKCPLLTSEKIATINASEHELSTSDTYESMALSRHASAVGIGVALRELQPESVDAVLADGSFNTRRASCSSGAELEDCHILILANDTSEQEGEQPPSILRAFSGVMASAIDHAGLRAVLDAALTPVAPYRTAQLVQVFAKAEADPTGLVDGRYRHTMLTDSDLHSTRHARAAVGGLIAGVTGDCHVYVSGGAEGQGPKGGGGLCVVARWEQ